MQVTSEEKVGGRYFQAIVLPLLSEMLGVAVFS